MSAAARLMSPTRRDRDGVTKAIILVGGYGTRLRPLTLTVPKPSVEFCNIPMVAHQLTALKILVEVDEVILAVGYNPEPLRQALDPIAASLQINLIFSEEKEPLGTAGPLALAREHLNTCDQFFMLNADVSCDFPFRQMMEEHQAHPGEATLLVKDVPDPSRYGVVVFNDQGRVMSFVEKPKEYVGNCINAGVYLLDRSVIDRVELRKTSIEREVFPAIVSENKLYCTRLKGFWIDIGKPVDFIKGQRLLLDAWSKRKHMTVRERRLSVIDGEHIRGNVVIDPAAQVAPDAVIGPDVVIGADCVVMSGARIRNSCLLPGAVVEEHALVRDSIVGWKSHIKKWARVEDMSVLGCDVTVASEVILRGCRVLPHKVVSEDSHDPQIIM